IWWWATVGATAAGIGILFTMKSLAMKTLAIVLIALPHNIGAPQHGDHASNVPAALATTFAANSIATAAVFWIVLGVMLGYMLSRNTTDEEAIS
ncbi:MAG: CbtA family protein, partial [Aestuariivirgaceae bacterium]